MAEKYNQAPLIGKSYYELKANKSALLDVPKALLILYSDDKNLSFPLKRN
jgi:hypothetical protein